MEELQDQATGLPPEPADPAAADEAAWGEVRARWGDEEAHRAYLSGCADLDGLARAGGRYKAALDAAPGDPVALRWRDEVVKRATVLALAQLPRSRPPRQVSPGLRRLLLAVALVAAAAATGWILLRFPRAGSL